MKAFAQKMKTLLETRKQMLESKKRNNDGFTLLELLVVVAILAAIAGTATIALKDTDARAAAAAHVTMMDELNKGIATFRVLQRNVYPNRLDSLMQATAEDATPAATALSILGFAPEDGYAIAAISADVQGIMNEAGITQLRYVNTAAEGEGFTCTDLAATVESRANDVVPGNIFMSPAANGCGFSAVMGATTTTEVEDPDNPGETIEVTSPVLHNGMYWTGGTERLTGQVDPAGAGSDYNDPNNYAYLMTGIGPSSTLFDANTLGGMTTVPVYRHVKPNEYNRFIAVWNVGTYDAAGDIVVGDQLDLTAIIDGALDTKEEELGEWDGTRNTI